MTIEEFTKRHNEILDAIPVELQGAIGYLAWERGHSAGYAEVLICLQDLVSSLREPLQKLETRYKSMGV